MIKITQIDEALNIYKNNKVICVVYEINDDVKHLLKTMTYLKIEMDRVFINEDIPDYELSGDITSPLSKLNEYLNNSKSKVVVQLLFPDAENLFSKNFPSENILKIITVDEASSVLYLYKRFKHIKNTPIYQNNVDEFHKISTSFGRNKFMEYVSESFSDEILVVCSPPKTGNITIETTLKENEIPIYNMQHMPRGFNSKLHAKMPYKTKIITAVRDPISQNLSCAYEFLLNGRKSIFIWYTALSNENVFFNGGDANKLLEVFDKYYGVTEFNNHPEFYGAYSIATYYNAFKDHVIDLSKYPFDKEKGYTIIKEGNLEIFVYQLEKLNGLVKEFSDWVGDKEIKQWEVSNEAENKWIADSYKVAQKEIKFPREYFERCYDEPWVKHFYTEKDIEKFKKKWESHIEEL